MKKTMIAVLVSFAVSSFAMAGEEIQLAAAMGGATTTTATTTGTATTAAGAAGNMAALGVIAGAGIATIAQAGSTTSHP